LPSLISDIVKYIILILAAIYTYSGFRALARISDDKKRKIYSSEACIIIVYHFLGFLCIFIHNNYEIKYLLLYAAELALMIASLLLYRSIYRTMSVMIFLHMLFLLSTGFIFISRLDFDASVKQTIFSGAALTICLLIPYFIEKAKFLRNVGFVYGILGIAVLGYVYLKGEVHYGAKNWITLFGKFTLQPSEFVKILLIFMIASMLYVSTELISVIAVTILSGIMILLLVAEKDLGGALIFFVTFAVMMWCGTRNKILLSVMCLGGVAASIIGYQHFSHVQVRVMAFLDPWKYIDREGYQVAQSLFGIGSGGWFGFGLCNGAPKITPVVSSDFIFSGICEEMGILFGFCLILIYLCTFMIMINIAWRIKNSFHQLISIGCCVMYGVQLILSIGGAIKMVPSTGVTMALVSYGGSSVISTIMIYSIIQGLYVANNAKNRVSEQAASTKGKERRTEIKSISRPVGITYTFVGLFTALIAYLTYFQFAVTPKVINNAYNKRLDLYASTISRGKILANDGTVLAYTKEKDGSSVRVYPYSDIYSHVVGRNVDGKTGIEALMNYQLFTSDDNVFKRIGERFSGEKNEGNSVNSTLDTKLQLALDKAMTGYPGAAVAIEPSTGRILALVSKPDYDPNTVDANYTALTQLTGSDASLLNRAVNGLYPPGSTFKIVSSLEYIRENKTYKKFKFDCTGDITKGKTTIECYNHTAHGEEDFTDAFANSCNSAFASMGLDFNLSEYHDLADSLMFNESLPFPIAANKSSFTLNTGAKTDEIMQTAIGQGKTQISPAHNAMLAAAIANNGVVMKPYLVDSISTYDGKRTIKSYSPSEYTTICSEKEAKVLKKFMKAVVDEGTAKKLSWLSAWDMYGKTGTAEYNDENGEKLAHSWFTGFGKKGKKTVAIAVVLEGEKRGNLSATDVVYSVFSNY